MIAPAEARRIVAAAVIGLAYMVLNHVTVTAEHPPLLGLVVGFATLVIAIIAVSWTTALRWPVLAALALAVAYGALHRDLLVEHVAAAYFVQHVGAMAGLFIMFGSTLGASPEQALCSRIAAFATQQRLDPVYARYTRGVTLAWTVYFALMGASSVLLYLFAPMTAWSLLANVVTPVTLLLMFAGEYLLRDRLVPGRPHLSVRGTIEAYRSYVRSQRPG